MQIGIIGCGNISPTYFNSHKLYNNFKVMACADINHEVAINSASEYGVIPQKIDEIFSNPDIDLILNLTVPSAHKEIIIKTLESGKHSFSEKPLAMSFREGEEIYKLAKEKLFYASFISIITFLHHSSWPATHLQLAYHCGLLVLKIKILHF